MMDRLMALFAYAVMAASLLVLVWYVPRWDLGGVIAVTLALAGVDVVQSLRSHRRPRSQKDR
ncbi:hypothetical protein [Paracoccus zhejiangensis]|uniref:Uncharacterized protein n=1 Tax=Paracoccus zhejiangensis TaxID=1077935 RepID=A0A2H5F049_9RHOB|nr:hypothetical protein [Paracoccus zhejiangensis]AUH64917.1 hypothetical protein CX676_12655 [Paracoccus zhejiangensis]